MYSRWIRSFLLASCAAVSVRCAHIEAQSPPQTRGVVNGGFETGASPEESGWSWWSIHGEDAGSAEFSDIAREGGRSVKIEHDGEMMVTKDWLLVNEGRLNVKPGEQWTASAWVKYEDTDQVGIEIMGMTDGKEISQLYDIHKFLTPPRQGLWPTGYAVAYGTGDWELLEASAIIPPEIDQVYVRIGGIGKTKAWVDDVRMRKGMAERTAPPKPKVEGWAFDGERVKDRLGRSVFAQPLDGGRMYVQWRLLERDPQDIAFNVYRSAGGGEPVKLNDEPVTKTTDFIDETADSAAGNVYMVRPVGSYEPFGPSDRYAVPAGAKAKPYVSIPLKDKDATFGTVAVGDLNGDGRYDYVIKTPAGSLDPVTWRPSEYTYKLEAYLSDGTFLWRRDLGWNIEAGKWYSPYIVYDLDGDGRAEVAAKTAPMDVDYRDTKPSPRQRQYKAGRVTTGPEYVSILDGMTGAEKARADWPSREGMGRYNHDARHQMGVAYLDGKTPALVVARGTYTVLKIETYQYQGGELEQLWYWDATQEPGGLYFGQGAHTMHAADLDKDGRDELVIGSCTLDDNGDGLWSRGVYHPDNLFVGDIDPTRPGLEIYYGVEGTDVKGVLRNGTCLVDAATAKLLWGLDQPTHHVHGRGMVSDIDPNHVGMEAYSGERDYDDRWLHSAKGKLIADETQWAMGLNPGVAYWDADRQREVVHGGEIFKFPHEVLVDGLEGRWMGAADLFGDWREEIITAVPGEIRIYMTDIPAKDRRVSMMEDPIYRNNVAHWSMGYSAGVPLTSYYFGRK